MWEAFTVWVTFIALVSGTIQILYFIFNILLGVVLMWFAVYTVLLFYYNCIYSVLYAIGATANVALEPFCRPFVALGAFLGCVGILTLIVLHLALRGPYYIVVLWLLVYMLNMLYRFVQHRDFALKCKFFFWT